MEKCCENCAWFSNRVCHNEKMIIKRELIGYAVDRTFDDIKGQIAHYHPMRSVVRIFEDAVLDWLGDANFEPNEPGEFCCKYYE